MKTQTILIIIVATVILIAAAGCETRGEEEGFKRIVLWNEADGGSYNTVIDVYCANQVICYGDAGCVRMNYIEVGKYC